MADVRCPTCGKSNPEALEICQYCGTLLNAAGTEPLAPIRPGEFPTDKKTSDLERTLPGWLRSARRAENESNTSPVPQPRVPKMPQPENPPPAQPPKKKEPASPLDLLAGLSQASDDDEDTPDWLKSLGLETSAPAPAPSTPAETESADWLSQLEEPAAPQPEAQEPAQNWGFGSDAPAFRFDDNEETSFQSGAEETPDWLNALKAQEENVTRQEKPAAPRDADQPPPQEVPDWLASLGPVGGSASTPPQPASQSFDSSSASNDPAPDWLSQLGGGDFNTEAEPPAPAAAASDTPDWLASLGGNAFDAQPENPALSEPASPAAETPDWLANLGSPEETQPESPQSAVETPDWLADLGNEAQQPAETVDFSANTPDWLASLGAGNETPAQAEPATPTAAEETPDWLSSLGNVTEAPAGTPEPAAADTPDWLSSLGSVSETPAAETLPAAETSDWLSNLGSTSEAPAETPEPVAADTPDWLSSLGSIGENPLEELPTQPEPALPAAEPPDWLASLGEETKAPTANTQPAEETPDWLAGLGGAAVAASTTDLPDWLAGTEQPAAPVAEPPSQSAPETEAAAPVSDLPDWMAELQQSEAAATIPSEGLPAEAAAADLPDWIVGLQPAQQNSALYDAPTVPLPQDEATMPAAMNTLPDWLAEAVGEAPQEAEPVIEPERTAKPFDTGSLGDLGGLGKTGELPDWMAGLTAAESQPSEPAQPEPAITADDTPDWLAGLTAGAGIAAIETATQAAAQPQAEQPAEAEPMAFELPSIEAENSASVLSTENEQNVDSILSMEMPDWLSGFTPSEPETQQPQAAAPTDDDLRPAELPSWVQAMRPVESVISETAADSDDEDVEKVGPLAGFHNVLPVLPDLLKTSKPKVYSIKLQMDETQRAQSALLEQLLSSENAAYEVATPKPVLTFKPLRWAIAIVLLLAALVPAILGSRFVPAPTPGATSGPVFAFQKTVAEIADASPVLVVVDYQPGMAAEMEAVSDSVLKHLASRNARLAFVTTLPVGNYMSSRLALKLNTPQAVDLGYLPGGAAGVQVFANSPTTTVGRTILPEGVTNLWQSTVMDNRVQNLADFAALVVLTDDPDDGRLWIEQTALARSDTPILMVTSAQAAPMLRPFFDSGQVQGMISGLEGGILYEQMTGLPDGVIRTTYWDGFGLVSIAAELLILVGGIWGLLTGIRARRESLEQDEA